MAAEEFSKIPGLRNWEVPVPGSTVTAFLGRWDSEPYRWLYSLWTDDDDCVSSGVLDMTEVGPDNTPVTLTPEQVARIAFILDVEYNTDPETFAWVTSA